MPPRRRQQQIEVPEVRDIEVAAEVRRAGVDRVAVPSIRADGSPDQSAEFEVIE